jgi:hypothetical protein
MLQLLILGCESQRRRVSGWREGLHEAYVGQYGRQKNHIKVLRY